MSRLKAFIVEDSPVIRESLIAALEETELLQVIGYADSEGDAVQWLGQGDHGCDIAIVDIVLRNGSGIGVLKTLQRAGATMDRVVFSNHTSQDMRSHCLRLGASQVFDKSAEFQALIEHCATLAAGAASTGSARS